AARAARLQGGSAAGRLGSWAARRLGGRLHGGSASGRPGGSAAARLGGGAARLLCCWAARLGR
ncbi:unnamed protein product, partial [Closterium sp. Naga37s-1]